MPSPADFPDPEIKPGSPALQADSFYQLIYQGNQQEHNIPDFCSLGAPSSASEIAMAINK